MKFALKDRHFLAFILILAGLSVFIFYNFPKQEQYYMNADEGMYFKRATIINEYGLNGFPKITNDFIVNEWQHYTPNPCRYLYYMTAALFVGLNPTIESLSFLSLFCFIITGLIMYIYIKKLENEKTAFFIRLLNLSCNPSNNDGLRDSGGKY